MSRTFGIKSVISVVDKITSPLSRINARIKQAFKPIRQLHNATVNLTQELGFPKIGRGWADVRKAMGGVQSEVKALGTSIGIMTAAATAAISILAWSTSSAGDKAAKTAQQIGISTQAWTELAHAGDMSGVSAEKMRQNLSKLNKALFEAAAGNKKANYYLRQAGVSLYDGSGRLRSADQALGDIANKFADPAFNNAAKRSALAMGLFGEAGVELIPFLNAGSEGIAELRAEAVRLGITFSDLEGKQAEEFGDSISRVKRSLDGAMYSIGKMLLPTLSLLGDKVSGIVMANRELVTGKVQYWIVRITDRIPALLVYLSDLWARVETLAVRVDGFVQTLGGWEKALKYVGIAFVGLKLAPLALSIATLIKSILGLSTAIGGTLVKSAILAGTTLKGVFVAIWGVLVAHPIIAIITGIAVGAYLIYRNWGNIGPWFKSLWGSVKRAFSDAWAYIAQIFPNVTSGITNDLNTLGNHLSWLAEFVKKINPFKLIYDAADSLSKYLFGISLYDAGELLFSSLWQGIKSVYSDLVTWFSGIFSHIYNSLLPDLQASSENVKAAFKDSFIGGLLTALKEFDPARWIMKGINAAIEYITGVDLQEYGSQLIDSLWTGLKNRWDALTGWLQEKIDSIINMVPDFLKGSLGIKVNAASTPSVATDASKTESPTVALSSPALQMMRQRIEQQREMQFGQVDVNFHNTPSNAHVRYGQNVAGTVERKPYADLLMGQTGLALQ